MNQLELSVVSYVVLQHDVKKMSQEPDKRQLRQLKRAKKRAGNKHRRQQLKDQLRVNPEAAHEGEVDFGRHASEGMNGLDHDHTRQRPE